jgi:hypothetical protein
VRITPDRCAVFADHQVGAAGAQRHSLGVCLDQREADAELVLQSVRGGQLPGRNVHPDRARAAPGQPRRDMPAAAAELHSRHASQVGWQDRQPRLGDAPYSPVRLGGRPPGARVPLEPGRQLLVLLPPGDRHVTARLIRHGAILGNPVSMWRNRTEDCRPVGWIRHRSPNGRRDPDRPLTHRHPGPGSASLGEPQAPATPVHSRG